MVLSLATGCASSGSFTMNQPVSVKLSHFKSATVAVKSGLNGAPERLDEYMEQLESRIVVKLREQALFGKIYSHAETDSHADLGITVTITKIRDINDYDRVMWGALAGQATTHAKVDITDLATGKLIGSGEIVGKSSDNGTVFSGTTPQAVDRVADAVVDLVKSNL
jgi:hypothetical protein